MASIVHVIDTFLQYMLKLGYAWLSTHRKSYDTVLSWHSSAILLKLTLLQKSNIMYVLGHCVFGVDWVEVCVKVRAMSFVISNIQRSQFQQKPGYIITSPQRSEATPQYLLTWSGYDWQGYPPGNAVNTNDVFFLIDSTLPTTISDISQCHPTESCPQTERCFIIFLQQTMINISRT